MRKWFWVLAGVAVLGSHVHGAMVSEGTRELAIGGMVDETEDLNLAVNASTGLYISDFIEMGGGVDLDYMGGDIDTITLVASVFGQFDLIRRPTTYMPFAGARVGLGYADMGDETNTALELAGFGGIRYYLLDNLALSLQLDLKFATDDIYNGGDEMEAFDWTLDVATRFYF